MSAYLKKQVLEALDRFGSATMTLGSTVQYVRRELGKLKPEFVPEDTARTVEQVNDLLLAIQGHIEAHGLPKGDAHIHAIMTENLKIHTATHTPPQYQEAQMRE